MSLAPPDLAGIIAAATIVMRQGGFAVGIAVLGAVLHNQGSAISYLWPFVAAAAAFAAGLVAALVLLPAREGIEKSNCGQRVGTFLAQAAAKLPQPIGSEDNSAPGSDPGERPERIG